MLKERFNVPPSMARIRDMNDRKATACRASKLLQQEVGQLITRRGELLKEVIGCFFAVEKLFKEAYITLAAAKYNNSEFTKMVLESVTEKAQIRVQSKPDPTAKGALNYFCLTSGPELMPLAGLSLGGQRIQKVRNLFRTLIENLMYQASVKAKWSKLDIVIRHTLRKVNVIDKTIIPKITNTLIYIRDELDEREREDMYRLKKVKEKLDRKKRKHMTLNRRELESGRTSALVEFDKETIRRFTQFQMKEEIDLPMKCECLDKPQSIDEVNEVLLERSSSTSQVKDNTIQQFTLFQKQEEELPTKCVCFDKPQLIDEVIEVLLERSSLTLQVKTKTIRQFTQFQKQKEELATTSVCFDEPQSIGAISEIPVERSSTTLKMKTNGIECATSMDTIQIEIPEIELISQIRNQVCTEDLLLSFEIEPASAKFIRVLRDFFSRRVVDEKIPPLVCESIQTSPFPSEICGQNFKMCSKNGEKLGSIYKNMFTVQLNSNLPLRKSQTVSILYKTDREPSTKNFGKKIIEIEINNKSNADVACNTVCTKNKEIEQILSFKEWEKLFISDCKSNVCYEKKRTAKESIVQSLKNKMSCFNKTNANSLVKSGNSTSACATTASDRTSVRSSGKIKVVQIEEGKKKYYIIVEEKSSCASSCEENPPVVIKNLSSTRIPVTKGNKSVEMRKFLKATKKSRCSCSIKVTDSRKEAKNEETKKNRKGNKIENKNNAEVKNSMTQIVEDEELTSSNLNKCPARCQETESPTNPPYGLTELTTTVTNIDAKRVSSTTKSTDDHHKNKQPKIPVIARQSTASAQSAGTSDEKKKIKREEKNNRLSVIMQDPKKNNSKISFNNNTTLNDRRQSSFSLKSNQSPRSLDHNQKRTSSGKEVKSKHLQDKIRDNSEDSKISSSSDNYRKRSSLQLADRVRPKINLEKHQRVSSAKKAKHESTQEKSAGRKISEDSRISCNCDNNKKRSSLKIAEHEKPKSSQEKQQRVSSAKETKLEPVLESKRTSGSSARRRSSLPKQKRASSNKTVSDDMSASSAGQRPSLPKQKRASFDKTVSDDTSASSAGQRPSLPKQKRASADKTVSDDTSASSAGQRSSLPKQKRASTDKTISDDTSTSSAGQQPSLPKQKRASTDKTVSDDTSTSSAGQQPSLPKQKRASTDKTVSDDTSTSSAGQQPSLPKQKRASTDKTVSDDTSASSAGQRSSLPKQKRSSSNKTVDGETPRNSTEQRSSLPKQKCTSSDKTADEETPEKKIKNIT